MKQLQLILALAGCLLGNLLAPLDASGDLWWDTDGATPGSSSDSTPQGQWGGTNWTTDPAGASATQAWVPGETAVFSAGTDATGFFFDVTLAQSFNVAGIRVEEGVPRIRPSSTQNVLNFANGALLVDTGSHDLASDVLFGPTNGVITKVGSGNFSVSREQTSFAGKWIINEGVVLAPYGSSKLGINPAAVVPDYVTVNNGAGVFAYGFPNQGLTLGPGGGGFKSLDQNSSYAMSWSGPITGTSGGPLIIEAHAVYVGIWNPNNDYDGDTVLKDGIVVLEASSVIPDTSDVQIIGASVLHLNGTEETVNSLSSISAARLVLSQVGRPPIRSAKLTIQNPDGETIASPISGGGTLVKNGAGSLIISGDNSTYTFVLNSGTVGVGHSNAFGPTNTSVLTINGGTIANTAATERVIPASVTINSDFTVDDSLNPTPGPIRFNGLATLSASRTISVDGNASASMELRESTAGVGLTKMGSGTLELRNATSTGSGLLSGTINVAEGRLQIHSTGLPVIGTGLINLAGGTLNTTNHLSLANPIQVTADSAITTTSTGSVSVGFSNPSVSGSGKLTLRNDAPSGNGIFVVGFGGTNANFMPGPIEIANGAFGTTVLRSNHPTWQTFQVFPNEISGTGSFVVHGVIAPPQFANGTILSAANTYSGGTTVNSGTLIVNNTTGSGTGTGPVTVSGAAALSGTGTIAGAVTNAGQIAPGASVGTLTLESDLSMSAGSHLAIELNDTAADKLIIGGNLDLSGDDYLDVVGSGTGPWVIATYGGMLSGTFDHVTPGYSVDYTTSGQIMLNAMALPGDFNSDAHVDAADYIVWRKTPDAFSGSPAGYNAWQANFGNPVNGGLASASSTPEPESLPLIALVIAFCFSPVRRVNGFHISRIFRL